MRKFQYKAWDEDNNLISEIIEEEEINSAKESIKAKGLRIIDISEKRDIEDLKIFNRKFSDSELSEFCGQMAIIINSGVNILKGLEVLQQQMKNKRMQKELGRVHMGVKRGKTLGKSMEDTGSFPKLLCDMINSGELSGDIDNILFNMEGFYEKEAHIKSKIITASIYPAILLFVGFGMIIFFNFFIFGELKELFKDTQNLPFATKALIASMDFFNAHLTAIIVSIFLLIILIKYLTMQEKVKYFFDKITLKNPITRVVKINMITARFARSMSIFLRSSVPILSSMDSLKLIVDNLYVASKLENVKNEMVNGNGIADAFEKEKIFEPLVAQMIRVGEESGKLEEVLQKLAEIYDKKCDASISKLMAMIEPAFTLIIGGFVAIVILAIATPVMNMTNTMR